MPDALLSTGTLLGTPGTLLQQMEASKQRCYPTLFFLERATLHLMFTQHAAVKEYGTQALLFFFNSPSHRIFKRMHEVLNINKNKN